MDEKLINELLDNLNSNEELNIGPITHEEHDENNFNNLSGSNNISKIHDVIDTSSFNESLHYQNYNLSINNVYKKKKMSKGKLNSSNNH